ncbi:hypothetical protein GCM10023334_076490 [Nonomuraea thailandensis]
MGHRCPVLAFLDLALSRAGLAFGGASGLRGSQRPQRYQISGFPFPRGRPEQRRSGFAIGWGDGPSLAHPRQERTRCHSGQAWASVAIPSGNCALPKPNRRCCPA